MAQLHLRFGEQDGLVVSHTGTHPEIYYAVSLENESKIKLVKGARAKQELRRRLAVVAYTFKGVISRPGVGLEYQYHRSPAHDKCPLQEAKD